MENIFFHTFSIKSKRYVNSYNKTNYPFTRIERVTPHLDSLGHVSFAFKNIVYPIIYDYYYDYSVSIYCTN